MEGRKQLIWHSAPRGRGVKGVNIWVSSSSVNCLRKSFRVRVFVRVSRTLLRSSKVLKHLSMLNLQDFLLDVRMEDDRAVEDDLLNERLDIVLRRVIADLNMPSSDGLKQEKTFPREDA